MKQIGVYMDISNLYYCVKQKYEGRKLDYSKFLQHIKDLGNLVKAVAYGIQMKNEASPFIRSLQKQNIETKYKGPREDWSVGIVIDIIDDLENHRVDTVFIASSNRDLAPFINHMRSKNIDIIIFAAGISNELKTLCQTIEIPESLLEDTKDGESKE